MTKFQHQNEHSLECDCSYCKDVDPNKSVARELERCIEELITYSLANLSDTQQSKIHEISNKILLLRRYFPTMELPSKHTRLLKSL
jgi:hypothetical protein